MQFLGTVVRALLLLLLILCVLTNARARETNETDGGRYVYTV